MAKQLTVIDSVEPEPETTQLCPNCGEALGGEYCHGCGQKRLDRRELSVRRFFINATNEFTDLESNQALQTFKALLFKPGR